MFDADAHDFARSAVRLSDGSLAYSLDEYRAAAGEPDAPAEAAPSGAAGRRRPFALGERAGAWYPVLDGEGAEVDKVLGRDNALAAVAALNAGTADGTAA